MSNRIEGTRRKLSHMPTGRLKPLRLFSTLLAIPPGPSMKWLHYLQTCFDELWSLSLSLYDR
jgi:hypothetical protein